MAAASRFLQKAKPPRQPLGERRLRVLLAFFILAIAAVVVRLFILQVLAHSFYMTLAEKQPGQFTPFEPQRGSIYLKDDKAAGSLFPVATNRPITTIYANPKEVTDPRAAAKALAPRLSLAEADLLASLAKADDPYEVLKRRLCGP
jgi:cell division protein FtsI/penicillin-binding protein 2